jgi:hypothetical protein
LGKAMEPAPWSGHRRDGSCVALIVGASGSSRHARVELIVGQRDHRGTHESAHRDHRGSNETVRASRPDPAWASRKPG